MKNRLKREFHYFVLTDYELEEAYLREMHNQGYKFMKVKIPGFYYFEECEPEDVIYKLDFNPQSNKNIQNYLQMYRDYGWEYIQDLNEYSYFKKKAEATDQKEELEIFSDDESRLGMLKNIYIKRLLPITFVFLLCVLPQILHIIDKDWFVDFYSILGACFVLFYMYLMGRCSIGFYRLYKKYSNK